MDQDDQFHDDEDGPWADDDSDEDEPLLSCPSCRTAVHEDTQQCPHCGDWIIPTEFDGRWRRLLWTGAAILLILALFLATVR